MRLIFCFLFSSTLSAQTYLEVFEKKSKSLPWSQKEDYLQNITSDTLELLLSKTKSNQFKIDLLHELSIKKRFGQIDSAILLVQEAQKNALENKYIFGTYKSLKLQATFAIQKGDFPKARQKALQSMAIAKKNNYFLGKAVNYKIIATAFQYEGNSKEALAYYFKSLEINKANNYTKYLIFDYLSIGLFYESQESYDDALRYFRKAQAVAENEKDISTLISLQNNISLVLEKLNEYQKAINLLNKNISVIQKNNFKEKSIDLSITHQSLGIVYSHIFEKNPQDTASYRLALENLNKTAEMQKRRRGFVISETLQEIASVYANAKSYEKADFYFQEAIKSAKDRKGMLNLCRVYFLYADYLFEKSDLASAKINIQESLRIAQSLKAIKEQRDASHLFAKILAQAEEHKLAYQYQLQFKELSDSLLNENIAKKLLQMEMEMEFQKKEEDRDKKIAQEEKLNQDKINFQLRLRNFFIVAFLLVLIFAYWVFRLYARQQGIAKQLFEQTQSLEKASKKVQVQREIMEKAYLKSKKTNEQLQLYNREIKEKSEEIEAQAEEIKEQNEEMRIINANLEHIIEDRTSNLIKAYSDLANTNKELDTFLYRASHDLRRPLTTLMGLRELANTILKDETAKDLFEKVNFTALNMDKMLAKLKMVHDVNSQDVIVEPIDFNEILNELFKFFQTQIQKNQIDWRFMLANNIAFHSNPDLIKLILQNLIENSILFSQDVQQPFIEIMIERQDKQLLMQVKDNGVGIDANYQTKIFEMYFRGSEKSQGNGLGLYVVKKAVEKLNGTADFHTELGLGTTFCIKIPMKV